MLSGMTDFCEITKRATDLAGGCKKVAQELGISLAAVSAWRYRGVPLGRVRWLAKASGIPREQLRPDVYGDSEQ